MVPRRAAEALQAAIAFCDADPVVVWHYRGPMWFSVTLGAAGSGRDFGAEVSTALVAERAYAGLSDPYFIVHHLSQFLVRESGDLFNTGTFNTGTLRGVGVGRSPQVWPQPGDVITLGVDGLGAQRQTAMGPW